MDKKVWLFDTCPIKRFKHFFRRWKIFFQIASVGGCYFSNCFLNYWVRSLLLHINILQNSSCLAYNFDNISPGSYILVCVENKGTSVLRQMLCMGVQVVLWKQCGLRRQLEVFLEKTWSDAKRLHPFHFGWICSQFLEFGRFCWPPNLLRTQGPDQEAES